MFLFHIFANFNLFNYTTLIEENNCVFYECLKTKLPFMSILQLKFVIWNFSQSTKYNFVFR